MPLCPCMHVRRWAEALQARRAHSVRRAPATKTPLSVLQPSSSAVCGFELRSCVNSGSCTVTSPSMAAIAAAHVHNVRNAAQSLLRVFVRACRWCELIGSKSSTFHTRSAPLLSHQIAAQLPPPNMDTGLHLHACSSRQVTELRDALQREGSAVVVVSASDVQPLRSWPAYKRGAGGVLLDPEARRVMLRGAQSSKGVEEILAAAKIHLQQRDVQAALHVLVHSEGGQSRAVALAQAAALQLGPLTSDSSGTPKLWYHVPPSVKSTSLRFKLVWQVHDGVRWRTLLLPLAAALQKAAQRLAARVPLPGHDSAAHQDLQNTVLPPCPCCGCDVRADLLGCVLHAHGERMPLRLAECSGAGVLPLSRCTETDEEMALVGVEGRMLLGYHVSFFGGLCDAGDPSVFHSAAREFVEESIGVVCNQKQALGGIMAPAARALAAAGASSLRLTVPPDVRARLAAAREVAPSGSVVDGAHRVFPYISAPAHAPSALVDHLTAAEAVPLCFILPLPPTSPAQREVSCRAFLHARKSAASHCREVKRILWLPVRALREALAAGAASPEARRAALERLRKRGHMFSSQSDVVLALPAAASEPLAVTESLVESVTNGMRGLLGTGTATPPPLAAKRRAVPAAGTDETVAEAHAATSLALRGVLAELAVLGGWYELVAAESAAEAAAVSNAALEAGEAAAAADEPAAVKVTLLPTAAQLTSLL